MIGHLGQDGAANDDQLLLGRVEMPRNHASGGGLQDKSERPVVGSPVSSADNRHSTSLSRENFTDKRGFMVPVAVSSARAAPPIKTARHTTSVQFVSGFIPHLLTLASVARMERSEIRGQCQVGPRISLRSSGLRHVRRRHCEERCDEAIRTPSFRDGALAPDPESRDSGFDASLRPGMTASISLPPPAWARRSRTCAGIRPSAPSTRQDASDCR